MKGVLDRFQISKTSCTACQKNITKGLVDIYFMPYSWKIPKFLLLLLRSENFFKKVRELFFNDCLDKLFPGY